MAKESNKESDVVTINIQPLLMPGAIVLSTIIFSISFLIGMSTLAGGGLKIGGTGTNTGTTGNGTGNSGSGATYESLAVETGVDGGQFTQCLTDKEFESEVTADTSDGSKSGISGTPGFIVGRVSGKNVDGVLISGAQPYDTFKTAIQAAIDNKLGSLDKTAYPAQKTTLDNDPIKGDSNAQVAVVEFTDFECPFCKRHHDETYPSIVSDFVDQGKAMYVIRDFPLSFHNPVATEAAMAAECVNKLGGSQAYYSFVDKYFANTATNGEGL